MKSNAEVAPFVSEVTQKGQIDAVIKAASSRLPSSKTLWAFVRPCDRATVQRWRYEPKFVPTFQTPVRTKFWVFLWRCKKIPTLFLCLGWGGVTEKRHLFLRFCGFECQKRGKNRGSDVALRAQKSAFLGSQRGSKIRRLGGVHTINCVFWGVKRRFFGVNADRKTG